MMAIGRKGMTGAVPAKLAGAAILAGIAFSIPAAAAGSAPPLPTQLLYAGRSVEFPAAQEQVFRLAELELLPALKRQKKDWAIVLDVDDTVLGNYEYERRVSLPGADQSDASWDEWIKEKAAPAIPGAREFLDKARRIAVRRGRPHGRIVYITDRTESQEEDTIKNLTAAGLFVPGRDVILTKRNAGDKKDVRRRCVEMGRTGNDPRCAALAPMHIVATFGDSFRDHIEMYGAQVYESGRRQLRDCMSAGRCFIVPNPMYGQWEPEGAKAPYE